MSYQENVMQASAQQVGVANQLQANTRSLPTVIERLEKIVSHLREIEGHLMHTLEQLEMQPSNLGAIKEQGASAQVAPPKPKTVLAQFYDALHASESSLGNIDRYRHEIAKLVTGS